MAFIDESFDLTHTKTFYIVGLAVVNPDQLQPTRQTLLDFYGGDALHAAPMFKNREDTSLRLATELVATNHDGLEIVVCAPIDKADTTGEGARRRCLEFILPEIHSEFGTELFIFDKRNLLKQDEYVANDLRAAKQLSRDSIVHHCQPSEEPLLGLPDVLAWSYRQHHLGRPEWFAPMKSKAKVTELPITPTVI
ncbi:hypothetical protein ACFUOZ_19515 [Paenarthrobacter sp. NPDC057355]|uniref:hypothetical protein n=1 Tax=Paenarthrobacter sp. NPDC057355 TaxID=3346105 RepID=UPI0036362A75